jgi:hypothetical protein
MGQGRSWGRQRGSFATSFEEMHDERRFNKSFTASAVEPGQDHRPETPTEAERHLVHPVHPQMQQRVNKLTLLTLGFYSKLRGCDLVALRVRDVCRSAQAANRAMVMQQKTHRPVQHEITLTIQERVEAWIRRAGLKQKDHLFPSRHHAPAHIGTRQYARKLPHWVQDSGLDVTAYGTHSIRRAKPRRSTRKRRISERCRSYLATQSSKARFVTWVSRSTMRWSWLSNWISRDSNNGRNTPYFRCPPLGPVGFLFGVLIGSI